MKIAICVSGICKGSSVQQNMASASEIFDVDPKDFFYSTWKGREKDCEKHNIKDFYTFEEPVMHYHPLIDIPEDIMPPVYKAWQLRKMCQENSNPKIKKKIGQSTKQILGHSYLLEKIPEEYDMIIRIRYDTYITPKLKAELKEWVNISYNESKACGFGLRTSRQRNINILTRLPHIWPDPHEDIPHVSKDWGGYLMDPMIFHKRDMFNSELMLKLHNNNSLLVAEYGWYQILSQPFGDNHESFYGGAQLEAYLRASQL